MVRRVPGYERVLWYGGFRGMRGYCGTEGSPGYERVLWYGEFRGMRGYCGTKGSGV